MEITKKIAKQIVLTMEEDTIKCVNKATRLMCLNSSTTQRQLFTGIEVIAAKKAAAKLNIDADCLFKHEGIDFITHARSFVYQSLIPRLMKQHVLAIRKANVVDTLNIIEKVFCQQVK